MLRLSATRRPRLDPVGAGRMMAAPLYRLADVPAEPPWMADALPVVSARAREIGRSEALPSMSWDAIMAQPPDPPPMLASGIPKVGLTVLAGPPKVGKTLYASQTALACRSTLVVEEGSLSGVSWRLRKQSAALGIVRPDLDVVLRQRIRLDERASVARLRAHVEARRPELLVLDPLNRLHGADENRPTQMTPVMDALAAIAYDYGIAVLCIHHLSKPSAERGNIWDRFRGATSIRSGTDANLILEGSDMKVTLVGEFRDAEPMSETLELDRDTLLFGPYEGPAKAGKVRPEDLVAYLQDVGHATAADVVTQFGVVKATARTALEGLPGISWEDGPRGTRIYALGTGQ